MNDGRFEDTIWNLLVLMGEDPSREGLKDTPGRVSRMWRDFIAQGSTEPDLTTFKSDWFESDTADGTESASSSDQMILVTDLSFYSMCEHHMLPFFGKCHIGYIPGEDGRVVGLSKLARVLRFFASRLQVQEKLTAQIANFLVQKLRPRGVCVMLSAEHLCLSMRGIRSPGHTTTTHAIRGDIDKGEFLILLRQARTHAS